jgi:hypothetical protein
MTTSGVSLRKSCGPLSGPRVDGGPSGTLYWDRISDTVQSVTVDWPDGQVSSLKAVAANQRVVVKQSLATKRATPVRFDDPAPGTQLLTDVTRETTLPFIHHEKEYVDFDRERMMPKMLSTEGPSMAVADVNGDGLDDIFIAGAKGQPSALLIQQSNGSFLKSNEKLLAQDSAAAARWRSGLAEIPLNADRISVSDLLFVDEGPSLPADLSEAIPRAHGGTKFARGKQVGLFWELYGKAPADSALPMSLTITPVDEGFLRRAFRVLRISPKVSPLNIRWQENGAAGMLSARSVLLDLSLVPAGKYAVKLEVGNSSAATTSRIIEIQ